MEILTYFGQIKKATSEKIGGREVRLALLVCSN
jgi:hypothetical protein